ncbi:conserved hypothetical protein [Aspergillus terreus NIH2624]|uniref:Hyaluronan/mRNA-binding protein domain-containing protein n=1 Tax=Aspergillus terreus (strain NIH 2624 / FGSC A1156) TaxID=341663 RepID=Q0CHJ7_ASPTN|nr:uncharacterized protein ATEG_06837 [Aspergillus terreus NIH2624]EAU33381.1 conserved hypothetical protein [Aspergillus terreus NIH2624]
MCPPRVVRSLSDPAFSMLLLEEGAGLRSISSFTPISSDPKISRASTMTRSHKANDRDHVNDRVAPDLPRYFGKSGPVDADPRKTKKDGGGKGNWGRSGDEVQDYDYTFTNARRYSNSSTQGLADFRTKFEAVETEPVFEERLHGPETEDSLDEHMVTKVDSTSSSSSSGANDMSKV